jgi:hypothetical protein
MDNFYTRHNLAAVLQKFTDGESRVIGTIKFTNVDGTNRYHLSKAMELMKDAPRGSWRLVQAYHKHPNYEKLQRDHSTQQRHLQPAERQPFMPPFDKVADCCGFIVLKDSKLVIFYSSDLNSSQTEPIMDSSDSRAVECVHGLAIMYRWTGSEVLNRTPFPVPAPIVAYNAFMNAVDRMDQVRSTLRTQRREKRVHMSVFTYLLDLSASQAYAVYKKLKEKETSKHSYFNFKRRICEQLVTPLQDTRQQHRAAVREAVQGSQTI